MTPALRAQRPEPEALAGLIAHAHLSGLRADWQALHPGARPVDLPTYAFQHRHFWLAPNAAAVAGTHPLLTSTVPMAGKDEWLLTGRLSLATHPWLADHAVHGTVLLPGTALVELALTAGALVECPVVEELTLHAPLIIPAGVAVEVQLRVEEPDEDGRRAFAVHSRAQDGEWAAQAAGVLADAAGGAVEALVWPPEDAEPLDGDVLYDRLAEAGFGYGPSFQAVTTAYRRGDEIYAEVTADDALASDVAAFAVHPALLDAGLHPSFDGAELRVPFSWRGVRVHGPGAATLRVRVVRTQDNLTITAFDTTGAPVLSVDEVVGRPIDPAQLASRAPLYTLEWRPLELPDDAPAAEVAQVSLLGDDAPQDPVAATHAQVERMLSILQTWLAEPGETRLAIVDNSIKGQSLYVSDPVSAAVRGLVRSAQSEHPGRILLVDTDDENVPWGGLLATDEQQFALRDGVLYAPRLVPAAAAASDTRVRSHAARC